MDAAATVREMISDYLCKYARVVEKSSRAAGLFGFGSSPKNDSCHTDFLERLASYLGSLQDISPEEATSIVLVIIDTALDNSLPESCHWTFIAAERYALRLIEIMPPEDKKLILSRYEKAVPRFRRLPVEKDLVRTLRQ